MNDSDVALAEYSVRDAQWREAQVHGLLQFRTFNWRRKARWYMRRSQVAWVAAIASLLTAVRS